MLLTFVFNKIHDITEDTKHGYYWSMATFWVLSIVALIIKIMIGFWDKQRGCILDSKTAFEDFEDYQLLHSYNNDSENQIDEMKFLAMDSNSQSLVYLKKASHAMTTSQLSNQNKLP